MKRLLIIALIALAAGGTGNAAPGVPPALPECSDGIDNDFDGWVDALDENGCDHGDPTDTSEFNF